jgi:hypothetical protein
MLPEADQNRLALVGLSLLGQLWLALYVYACVRRGFIWVRSYRIERKKKPVHFKWALRSYILFAAIQCSMSQHMTPKDVHHLRFARHAALNLAIRILQRRTGRSDRNG